MSAVSEFFSIFLAIQILYSILGGKPYSGTHYSAAAKLKNHTSHCDTNSLTEKDRRPTLTLVKICWRLAIEFKVPTWNFFL